MTYLLEIKETTESKALIAHLKTLKYVKMKQVERKSNNKEDIVSALRKSEKSKRVKWEDAKKQIAAWK